MTSTMPDPGVDPSPDTAETSRGDASHRHPAAVLWALAAAVLYAGIMVTLYPYRDVFAFDPDEGINAMKALLLERGYALFTQIWSDQPPLFTWLLRLWFDVFGWDVNTGRVLVLLFAAAIVFALYDISRLVAGHGAALTACGLLAASAYFPRLSVSLAIGLPAVALATLALWALFRWLHDEHPGWIAAAGALMGCSLACKLFTAVLLPVFGLWLVVAAPRDANGRRRWRAGIAWLLYTATTAGALLFVLVGPAQLPALVSSHVLARRAPGLRRFGPLGLAVTGLTEWPLTLLGLGAYAILVLRRRPTAAVFPAWAAAVALSLLGHAPVWYHHQLLLSVPHCAAAGIVLAELFRRNAPGARALVPMRLVGGALVLALLVSAAFGNRLPVPRSLAGAPTRVLASMRALAGVTRVVLATDPMYAFRAGYEVPPALAVLSLKRVATDPRLPDDIRAVLTGRPPEQVLLARGAIPEIAGWVRQSMANRYRLLFSDQGAKLFVRGDLAGVQ